MVPKDVLLNNSISINNSCSSYMCCCLSTRTNTFALHEGLPDFTRKEQPGLIQWPKQTLLKWIWYADMAKQMWEKSIQFNSVTLYLKPLCIMHYKSIFNALIMPCNAPYNALWNQINNCKHTLYIITLLVVIIFNKM